MTKKEKVTLAIPKELYDEIQNEIQGTGFSSPSEWIKYVLRQSIQASKKRKDNVLSFPYLPKKD